MAPAECSGGCGHTFTAHDYVWKIVANRTTGALVGWVDPDFGARVVASGLCLDCAQDIERTGATCSRCDALGRRADLMDLYVNPLGDVCARRSGAAEGAVLERGVCGECAGNTTADSRATYVPPRLQSLLDAYTVHYVETETSP